MNNKLNTNFYPKITIIIAAYNQEKNIESCLKSILCQSYKNLEIIVINDGSKDNTKLICEKFLNQDKRIKLINQNNGGISSARNTGLRSMTGDYVTFIDADDYIDSDLILNYIKYLTVYKNYILISGYKYIKNNKTIYTYMDKFNVFNSYDALKILFDDGSFKNFMWNKLYPSSFFDNIKFDIGKNYEDIRIQYKLFELSEKIVVCPFVGYNYIYYANSVSNSKKNIIDFIDAHIDRLVDIYSSGKYKEYVSLLSKIIFSSYISNCNIFNLRDVELSKKKENIIKKLNKIDMLLRKNLSSTKYFVFRISLKNNIFFDLVIYILWSINVVRRKMLNAYNIVLKIK